MKIERNMRSEIPSFPVPAILVIDQVIGMAYAYCVWYSRKEQQQPLSVFTFLPDSAGLLAARPPGHFLTLLVTRVYLILRFFRLNRSDYEYRMQSRKDLTFKLENLDLHYNMSKKKRNNQLPENLPQLQNLIKRDPASYKDEVSFYKIFNNSNYTTLRIY